MRLRGTDLLACIVAIVPLLLIVCVMSCEIGDHRNPQSARCKHRLSHIYKGVRMYWSDFEGFLPLAYHRSAQGVSDLSDISFHRFGIQEYALSGFNHTIVTDTKNPAYGTEENEAAWKFSETKLFFSDHSMGWTSDYFAPFLIFRGHAKGAPPNVAPAFQNPAPCDKHAQYDDLVSTVSSSQRPLMAGVNASYPNDERDRDDVEYDQEMTDGWSLVSHSGATNENGKVFVGVGQSLRTPGNYDTSRFDFRHNGHCNVMFLDSHIESIRKEDGAPLRYFHDRWNTLDPAGAGRE